MGGEKNMKQKPDSDEDQKIKYQIYRKLDKAQTLVSEIKELMKKINLIPSTEEKQPQNNI
ncbi:TPA: hypothetical protein DDY56_04555 [Candidatus Uhrbacteria bacterium]|nr:hypothetical protein [Candidatus Uhrbacteria bacterium]HCX25463.1 hypothetical protein [Candidatus Collierbacteria bacterium]